MLTLNFWQNVFAQTLGALVGLGYQVQQFLMDAWSYGSSQSRSRMFIVATAPGTEPLLHPRQSHDHPRNMRVSSLGTASNGKRFGFRRDNCTPFQHVSPAEGASDLPDVADSQVQLCTTLPDHRTPSDVSAASRSRIASVPIRPHGMGLVQAALKGTLTGEPLQYYERSSAVRKKDTSRSYSRVYPKGLFPTVLTSLQITCGVSGRTLHWYQNRVLTVMELRRAQGFLDNEVIIGSPIQQVVIIGNSVDRKVALALGLALRESWTKTNERHDAGRSQQVQVTDLDNCRIDDPSSFAHENAQDPYQYGDGSKAAITGNSTSSTAEDSLAQAEEDVASPNRGDELPTRLRFETPLFDTSTRWAQDITRAQTNVTTEGSWGLQVRAARQKTTIRKAYVQIERFA